MSRANIAGQHSSGSGAATEARQGSLPFTEHVRHFALAERAPHDDHDVDRARQFRENRAKCLANQAAGTIALHRSPNLARRRNTEPKRSPFGPPLQDEDQAVAAHADAVALNVQVFGALADAVCSAWSAAEP